MKNFDINEEVEKTLGALDHHERVDASPFFYTKLQSKLKKKEEIKQASFSLLNLWQPALIVILVIVNIFTISEFTNTNDTQSVYQLANEYGLNSSENGVQDYIIE